MKDFDEWNKIKKRTDSIKNLTIIDEGDIRWCRFGVNIGDETMGKGSNFSRPVLIVKKFSSNVFWGVPLTTKQKKGSWYFYIKKINRTVILNQMRLFDKKRLESRLYDFKISNLEINAVRDKIIKLLKS